MLYMVVDMAVEDPGARVVKWGPENDITIGGHQNDIFENRVIQVAWEALFFARAVMVHIKHGFPGDSDIVRELTLANYIVPPAMLMDWVCDTSILVDVNENDFEGLVMQCWLLEDMATFHWLRWPWGAHTVSLVICM